MCLRQGPCGDRRDERAGMTRVETTHVCSPVTHGWHPGEKLSPPSEAIKAISSSSPAGALVVQ